MLRSERPVDLAVMDMASFPRVVRSRWLTTAATAGIRVQCGRGYQAFRCPLVCGGAVVRSSHGAPPGVVCDTLRMTGNGNLRVAAAALIIGMLFVPVAVGLAVFGAWLGGNDRDSAIDIVLYVCAGAAGMVGLISLIIGNVFAPSKRR